jgi:hypothetical protein
MTHMMWESRRRNRGERTIELEITKCRVCVNPNVAGLFVYTLKQTPRVGWYRMPIPVRYRGS